jgi:hypothetical protein
MFQPSGRLGPPQAEIGITKQESYVFDRDVQCLIFSQKFAERNLQGYIRVLFPPGMQHCPPITFFFDLIQITH